MVREEGMWAVFQTASEINRSIEHEKLEASASTGSKEKLLISTGKLIGMGRLLGLFLDPVEAKSAGADDQMDQVMQILIDIRAHCRKKKDFEVSDLIRDRLAETGITLEDRSGQTTWRVQ